MNRYFVIAAGTLLAAIAGLAQPPAPPPGPAHHPWG